MTESRGLPLPAKHTKMDEAPVYFDVRPRPAILGRPSDVPGAVVAVVVNSVDAVLRAQARSKFS